MFSVKKIATAFQQSTQQRSGRILLLSCDTDTRNWRLGLTECENQAGRRDERDGKRLWGQCEHCVWMLRLAPAATKFSLWAKPQECPARELVFGARSVALSHLKSHRRSGPTETTQQAFPLWE